MKPGTHRIKDTDWFLFKNSSILLLVHICPSAINLDEWWINNAMERFKEIDFKKPMTHTYCGVVLQAEHEVAAWDDRGTNYYCPRCDLDCPQDVEDLALLANCHRRLRGTAQRYKYMVGKPDEHS